MPLRVPTRAVGDKAPCTQIVYKGLGFRVYALALKYCLSRYIGLKVYTIWVLWTLIRARALLVRVTM